jgi:hypothetical protein
MPEILTESFCERCGTRYTFESAAPRTKRIGKFKTLSKGLKNFVMSDDASLDEALASARSEEEWETTSQQLDAFHKTFNFCMTCRQYTCANCWNEVEGRCLTCAPHLGHEILPAPFPHLETNGAGYAVDRSIDDAPRIEASAWPMADLRPDETEVATEAIAEPEVAVEPEAHAAVAEPELVAEVGEPETVAEAAADMIAEPEFAAEAVAQPEPEPEAVAEAEVVAQPESEALVAQAPAEAAAEPAPDAQPAPADRPVDERAAAAAAQTKALLARFRPGQSIDAALEAYEASMAASEAESLPVEAALAEPAAALAEPAPTAPEPVAAEASEPLAAEPATDAAPEPVAAAMAAEPAEPPALEPAPEPTPEPATAQGPAHPSRPADDRVEVPTWRIVAPDPTPANGHPAEPAPPIAATGEPRWPGQPEWPAQAPAPDSAAAIMAARLKARDNEALWAASSREVVTTPPLPANSAIQAAVQSCVSCGLSLSATARFCRRCGTPQQH